MKKITRLVAGAIFTIIIFSSINATKGGTLFFDNRDAVTLEKSFFGAIRTGISDHFKLHPFQFVMASLVCTGGILSAILKNSRAKTFFANHTLVGIVEIKDFIGKYEDYLEQLQVFEQDPYVSAIMLDIDSPGGYAGVDAIIANEIKRIKTVKPVIANVGKMCASAAYYIASACDYIVAPSGAAIGSIGTYFEVAQHEKTPDFYKFGSSGAVASKTRIESFGGGKYKTLGDPFKPLTDSQREYLQGRADEMYELFSDEVAKNRKLDPEKKSEWADAQVFTGKRALELKLIDKVGSISDTKEAIKKIIMDRGLPLNDELYLFKIEKQKSLLARLFGLEGVSKSVSDFISEVIVKTRNKFEEQNKEKTILIS